MNVAKFSVKYHKNALTYQEMSWIIRNVSRNLKNMPREISGKKRKTLITAKTFAHKTQTVLSNPYSCGKISIEFRILSFTVITADNRSKSPNWERMKGKMGIDSDQKYEKVVKMRV